MAEFCVDCWNELNDSNNSEKDFILSEHLDLCEGCGELKNVIIIEREFTFSEMLKHVSKFIKKKINRLNG